MIKQLSDTEIILRINESTKLTFGQDYLDQIGSIISDLTHADYTFITKIIARENKAVPLVSLHKGVRIENINYFLQNTPCLNVTRTCVGYYPDNVQTLFPNDHYLKELSIEGYIGVAIVPKADEPPIGIVTCLYESASEYSPHFLKIIELIATIVQSRIEKEILLKENYLIMKENAQKTLELKYSNTLLKEIHHRLKNNLHVLSGILKLQALESGNKQVENQLNEAVDRVRAMALIHEKIYGTDRLYEISLVEYMEDLVQRIIASHAPDKTVVLEVVSTVPLIRPEPLASLAMILNELTINSLKYGFRNREEGAIQVHITSDAKSIFIEYEDDGEWLEPQEIQSMGTSLVEIFTEQLLGSFTLTKGSGTTYRFTFPKDKIMME